MLLTTALVLSAYLGVCQEEMYAKYGKHAKESMFMVVRIFILYQHRNNKVIYNISVQKKGTDILHKLENKRKNPALMSVILEGGECGNVRD